MTVGELPVVVQEDLAENLLLGVMLTGEPVRMICELFGDIFPGQAVLRVEGIGLAEHLVVVETVVVAGQSFECQALQDIREGSEIIFKGR